MGRRAEISCLRMETFFSILYPDHVQVASTKVCTQQASEIKSIPSAGKSARGCTLCQMRGRCDGAATVGGAVGKFRMYV
jgi:hypothetical protein